MYNTRKTATILGILFLVVMASWTLSFVLTEQVVNAPKYLENVFPNRFKIFIGAMFELIDIAAIIGIVVIMYSLMKRHNERMSIWYASFRILESILLVIAVICTLSLITLSEQYLKSGNTNSQYFEVIGSLLFAYKNQWFYFLLPFFYSAAAFVFYYFFLKSRLIPTFISVIVIVAAILILIGIPLDMIEFKPGKFIGIIGGLNEIILGIWLIVKGFHSSAAIQYIKD